MTAAWQRLRPQLLALAEARTATLDAEIVEGFIAAYTSHIETENGTLLPLAAQLISPADLTAIGANMAKRRGVALSPN
jgi:pyridoxamine 5'-phosphate oxidase